MPPITQRIEQKRNLKGKGVAFTARQVLELDESILRALVLDSRGNVLSIATRPAFKKRFTVPESFRQKAGTISIVALGIAQEVAKHMGPLQSMVYVYPNSRVLGIPIPKYDCEVIAITTRAVDGGYITDRVVELARRF